ncbi:MAG: PEP-CTERM sorting domain-containing protein [Microcystaceae cyanobacterium]
MLGSFNTKALAASVVGVLALTGLDAALSSAKATSFYFVPTLQSQDANLDADTIKDINQGLNGIGFEPLPAPGGDTVAFDIYVDLTDLPSIPSGVTYLDFLYSSVKDNGELQVLAETGRTPINVAGPSIQKVNTMTFNTTNPKLISDGKSDFGITLTEVTMYDGANFLTANAIGTLTPAGFGAAPSFDEFGNPGTKFNQVVEVQPVPEPLTMLGSAAAMGFMGAFNRKRKAAKSSQKESA